MNQLRALFTTMRPKQWTKNGFIFAALIFDEKLFQERYLLATVAGFLLFSAISGVVYIINDLVDMEKDRQHPKKRQRPLPSGQLSPSVAQAGAVGLTVITLALGFWLNQLFGLILLSYLILQLCYSFYLKQVVLLDILTIATGFVLRVAAGAPLAEAVLSPWLYICTTLLALFLGLSKRRGELVLLKGEAPNHRPILRQYNLYLLDHLINIVTAATIVAYALYSFSAPNLPPNHAMLLTVSFVIYGLFRYLYLIHVEECVLAPDEVLLCDRPLQIDLILWGASSVLILYLG